MKLKLDIDEVAETCRSIGTAIGDALPPNHGFCLAIFEFGGPGKTLHYISSANRGDVAKTLREMIARWETEPEAKA